LKEKREQKWNWERSWEFSGEKRQGKEEANKKERESKGVIEEEGRRDHLAERHSRGIYPY